MIEPYLIKTRILKGEEAQKYCLLKSAEKVKALLEEIEPLDKDERANVLRKFKHLNPKPWKDFYGLLGEVRKQCSG